MELKNENAFELWQDAINQVITYGEEFVDNEGRRCKELLNLIMILTNPTVSSIEKPIETIKNSKKWVYPSKDELTSIMFKEVQAPIYEYTYGGRIFNYQMKFNQVEEFVLPLLRADKNSRRAIINLYNPVSDSDINNRNAPGIIYVHFRIQNEKLLMTSHVRSNDLFFGWPANLFQLFNLQASVAKKLNVGVGQLTIISNSAHVFLEDLNDIKEILGDA